MVFALFLQDHSWYSMLAGMMCLKVPLYDWQLSNEIVTWPPYDVSLIPCCYRPCTGQIVFKVRTILALVMLILDWVFLCLASSA
jgi:hypothetical protein